MASTLRVERFHVFICLVLWIPLISPDPLKHSGAVPVLIVSKLTVDVAVHRSCRPP